MVGIYWQLGEYQQARIRGLTIRNDGLTISGDSKDNKLGHSMSGIFSLNFLIFKLIYYIMRHLNNILLLNIQIPFFRPSTSDFKSIKAKVNNIYE